MKYGEKVFSVAVGSDDYRKNFEQTFKREVLVESPWCHEGLHDQCDHNDVFCRCTCHALDMPGSIP